MKKVVVINDRGMGDCLISLMAVDSVIELDNDIEINYVFSKQHIDLFEHSIFNQRKNVHYHQGNYRAVSDILDFVKYLFKKKPDLVIDISRTRRIKKVMNTLNTLTFNKFPFKSLQGKPFDKSQFDALSLSIHDLQVLLERPIEKLTRTESIGLCELSEKPRIIVSMATSTKEHQIDVALFVELVSLVTARFPDKTITYMYSGTKLDLETKRRMEKQLPDLDYVQSELNKTPDYFSDAMMFIGLDTGIKHLAAYMNVPTFSFIPVKSYPYSHPYKAPHKCLRMDSPQEESLREFSQWLSTNFD
ncbi:glycosyltransferase family 9 protein [Vibrio maritimus]|uniref:glycosyltransferase family 9 protein n=1 Tax=Vibrio maritimus TaxID=990268 RepID=UPI001F413AA4|nr:hypothetical protein [Vibrio maritimus]